MLSAMDHPLYVLERAFQLASSGSCRSIDDIKRRLITKGYGTAQVTGQVLKTQLQELLQGARNQGTPQSRKSTAFRSSAHGLWKARNFVGAKPKYRQAQDCPRCDSGLNPSFQNNGSDRDSDR
jgi:hypothetical protein